MTRETVCMSDALQAAVPRDFDSLRAAIIERQDQMPKRLAQVAAFALANPDDIAFGTAASIAAAADVQPSTLVRLAHHLGYQGFSDLQTIFRGRLRERNSSYEERLISLEQSESGSAEAVVLNGFLTAAIQSLSRLSQQLPAETFSRAVEILSGAETIYLLGKRRSYPLAAHMSYAFSKLGIRHQIVASPNGVDPETIQFATPKDAALAISFSPYAPETIRHTEAMQQGRTPVVALTDSPFSPLARAADCWFEVSEADFSGFRSISASMALCMALPVAIAEKRRHRKSRER